MEAVASEPRLSGRAPEDGARLLRRNESTRLAAEVRRLVLGERLDEARERFGQLAELQQRRASYLACYVLGNADEADDAVQDAFVKVFQHIDRFREELPFELWFNRILINCCHDRQKAKRRRGRWLLPQLSEGWDLFRSTAPSPEAALIGQERRASIRAAVARLPERQRQVFLMCQVDGQSPKDVSEATGIGESTVRVHLFRALRKLRSVLEKNIAVP
jgi:RNA polymerase sigma-70 factor, ECF subfamily